jgi:DNA-binding MarR family transcriptional regulator
MTETNERLAAISQLDELFSKLLLIKGWRLETIAQDPEYSLNELLMLEAIKVREGVTEKGLTKLLCRSYSTIEGVLKGLHSKDLIEFRSVRGKRGTHILLSEAGKTKLPIIRASVLGSPGTMLLVA